VQPSYTRLVHGNTLTAAVVVENILTVLREQHTEFTAVAQTDDFKPTVFLTGATSKVIQSSSSLLRYTMLSRHNAVNANLQDTCSVLSLCSVPPCSTLDMHTHVCTCMHTEMKTSLHAAL
jgi:hypothetical protein